MCEILLQILEDPFHYGLPQGNESILCNFYVILWQFENVEPLYMMRFRCVFLWVDFDCFHQDSFLCPLNHVPAEPAVIPDTEALIVSVPVPDVHRPLWEPRY